MQLEAGQKEETNRERAGNNPWERVVSNCDFSAGFAPGGKDLTRMKQSMLNRRADIKEGKAQL